MKTIFEGEIWCLCTVTFGPKSSKLNFRAVYCSQLYGSLFGLKLHNCVYATIYVLYVPTSLKNAFLCSVVWKGGEILHFCRDGAVNDPSVQVIVVLYHSYFAHVGWWRRMSRGNTHVSSCMNNHWLLMDFTRKHSPLLTPRYQKLLYWCSQKL